MATAHIVASSYSVSNANYVTVTDPDNMYDPVSDSTDYATLQGRTRNSSTAYYCFINGFEFDDLPSNANVSAFSVKIKCYKNSQQRTGTNFYLRLCSTDSWSNAISGTTTSTNIGTSTNTITIPTGNLTWSQIKNYGSDFSIAVPLAGNSGSTPPRIYVYGAEIEVTYTAETVHPTSVSVSPSTASIEAGETVQLTETVLPSNATDKSVTWSSNNTSVATVSSSGLVTGVSAGSATITVTTVDGGKTATCAVTVTPAVMYEYALATSMEVGKSYLIANGNSGSVYLLSNESGGTRLLKGISATVSNGRISVNGATKAKAEFTCVRYTSGNDNTITVSSDNKYLYCDNANGLRMNAPATLDRFWHYRDNKFWQFKSTTADGYDDTSSEYKYYIELSSGNFTDNHVTSPSIADTNIPAIYIFEPYVPSSDKLYAKKNGSWVQVTKAYKKVNGSWVEQSDLTTVFTSGTNYVYGD